MMLGGICCAILKLLFPASLMDIVLILRNSLRKRMWCDSLSSSVFRVKEFDIYMHVVQTDTECIIVNKTSFSFLILITYDKLIVSIAYVC